MATQQSLTESAYSPPADCECGDRVEVNDDDGSEVVVVNVTDKRADQYELDPLAGTTVASYPSNDADPGEQVVEVVYVESVERAEREDDLPDGCTVETVHNYYVAGVLEDTPVRSYAFPVSELSA